jgi:predicted nucleic acid-binding protein
MALMRGLKRQRFYLGSRLTFIPPRANWPTPPPIARRFKMSLADAFAAALAKEKKAELITGDVEFKALEREIKIHWLP